MTSDLHRSTLMDQPIAMELPMADLTAAPHITLHPHSRRVRILDGGTLIADSCNAIELRECGHPHRQYAPKEVADMTRLSVSATVTYCPFRSVITYYSLTDIADIAWSYEWSIDEMKAIAGRLAFDAGKVEEGVE